MATEIIQHSEAGALPAHAADNSVPGLIQLAIERGVDVEVLERLVALQERVTERNARAAYFEALAAFQDECPEIRKSRDAKIATKNGGSYGYSFAPLEEITRTIRPIMRRHGLSYSFTVESTSKDVLNVKCILRHIDGHQEEAAFPVPIGTSAGMSDAQKNGAALTYGRRQSLIAVLGLTTADSDSDAAAPAPGKPDTITDREAADLSALMDEVGADRDKFLRWAGVRHIDDLPKQKLPEAIKLLQRKRGDA